MARLVSLQGYAFYACERCDFAYKLATEADACALYDLEHGMRSADITGKSIAPPARHWQAVTKFLDEEAKAAKKAAAGPPAAKPAGAAAPGAAAPPAGGAAAGAAAAKPAPPKLSPEELEARKKAALEKAAAMKAQKAAEGKA